MAVADPIRQQELGDGSRLWVQDVFYTLQGEGPFCGQPAVFVRLGGCNLRCYWCDTDYESSSWRPQLEELLAHIAAIRPGGCDLIVLTGGEPFRQNIAPLVTALLSQGLRLQIETNGTLWVELPPSDRLHIVCSPKTAQLHPDLLDRIDSYKYVLAAEHLDEEDGLPLASTQIPGKSCRVARAPACSKIYVMPLDCGQQEGNARNLDACLNSALKHGYNLSLQMHKLVGIR